MGCDRITCILKKSTVLFFSPKPYARSSPEQWVSTAIWSDSAPPATRTSTHAMVRMRHSLGIRLSVSRRARSRIRTRSFSFPPRPCGAAVEKPQSKLRRRQTPPCSILLSFSRRQPRRRRSTSTSRKRPRPSLLVQLFQGTVDQCEYYRTALLPINHCQCPGTACLHVNPCLVESRIIILENPFNTGVSPPYISIRFPSFLLREAGEGESCDT